MSEQDVEALAREHVIDRDGLVWRVVRDGGMATRAHYAGIVSIGIATLEREHGPLVTLAAHVAAARAEAWEALAGKVRALADDLHMLTVDWEVSANGPTGIGADRGRCRAYADASERLLALVATEGREASEGDE